MGRLARGYMMLRPVIWGPLAAEVGEKWNVVEAKVRLLELLVNTSHVLSYWTGHAVWS